MINLILLLLVPYLCCTEPIGMRLLKRSRKLSTITFSIQQTGGYCKINSAGFFSEEYTLQHDNNITPLQCSQTCSSGTQLSWMGETGGSYETTARGFSIYYGSDDRIPTCICCWKFNTSYSPIVDVDSTIYKFDDLNVVAANVISTEVVPRPNYPQQCLPTGSVPIGDLQWELKYSNISCGGSDEYPSGYMGGQYWNIGHIDSAEYCAYQCRKFPGFSVNLDGNISPGCRCCANFCNKHSINNLNTYEFSNNNAVVNDNCGVEPVNEPEPSPTAGCWDDKVGGDNKQCNTGTFVSSSITLDDCKLACENDPICVAVHYISGYGMCYTNTDCSSITSSIGPEIHVYKYTCYVDPSEPIVA